MSTENEKFLAVKDLCVEYTSEGKIIHAVNGVSFQLDKGRTLGLVGEAEVTRKYIETFHIRPGSAHTITNFMSGGNQQKVVLSKWIAADCKILLVDEPTRGVDVGAKEEIYEILNQLIENGLSILMVSSELPELLGTCDRIMVMNEGRQTGLFDIDECSEETLMTFATN